MFLLDTNVVSHARKARQNPRLNRWYRDQESVAIPYPVILEIEQGIVALSKRSPKRAHDLAIWFQAVLESEFYLPPMTLDVARKMAEMYCCRPLKNLWFVEESGEKRPGQDIAIAAFAMVYNLPIATVDTEDFRRINMYFALPGVYNPAFDTWSVQPTGPFDDDYSRIADEPEYATVRGRHPRRLRVHLGQELLLRGPGCSSARTGS